MTVTSMRSETTRALTTMFAMGWASVAAAAGGPDQGVAAAKSVVVASVDVTNTLPAERKRATAVVDRQTLFELAPVVAADFRALVVTDAAGRLVLSQVVDSDGDDEPDELVFQTDLKARETKTFKLRAGPRTPASRADYKVYGRFVRERYDDFVWENDLVAHRVYGPALESAAKEGMVSSGIDVWVKRTPHLVANDWYLTGDYHRDHGEGADFYAVGKSRGCGGLGIWAEGRLALSRNFAGSRVLANGPIRLIFELSYVPWEVAPGMRVAETKRITLDAGSQWNQIASTFTPSGPGKLSAGIGIAKHPGNVMTADAESASLRVWEPLKGEKGDPNGNLGCALVLRPGSPLDEHPDELNYVAVTPVPASGKLVYEMGTAWDRGGAIRDAAAWAREVQAQAARFAAPVKVSISVPK
jgi:unsaturated rhamnogalacturonyl hydrolase